MNHHLKKRGMKVNDLRKDLSDGKAMLALLEELSGQKLPKSNENPKMKIQKIQNINTALKYITDTLGCKLVNISAEDIHDGNVNIILGTLWTLILKYQINKEGSKAPPSPRDSAVGTIASKGSSTSSASSSSSSTAATSQVKKELLGWTQSRLKPFKAYCGEISNFTDSFANGMALCCLVESILPGSMKLTTLTTDKSKDPNCWTENNERAVYMAFKKLSIPNIIQGVDIALHPDELSIITYLSYFKEKTAGSRKQ